MEYDQSLSGSTGKPLPDLPENEAPAAQRRLVIELPASITSQQAFDAVEDMFRLHTGGRIFKTSSTLTAHLVLVSVFKALAKEGII